MKMDSYEYCEVERLSLSELNSYGEKGWMAVSMKYEESENHCSKLGCGNCGMCGWTESGYTGLMMRKRSG